MSYTFSLELESGESLEELVRRVSILIGIESRDSILIKDNIWMHVYKPNDVEEIDHDYGINPDASILIREQPIEVNDMRLILSFVIKILEANEWNAVLMDEQLNPVLIYKDKIYTWNKYWYDDLESVIHEFMDDAKYLVREFKQL